MVFSKRLLVSEKRTTGQGLGWIKKNWLRYQEVYFEKKDLRAFVSGITMDLKRGRGVVASGAGTIFRLGGSTNVCQCRS